MSYRCELCHSPAPPKTPRLVHRLTRPNGQTEREIPVCRVCLTQLAKGFTLRELLVLHRPAREEREVETVEVAVLPPPPASVKPPPVLPIGRPMLLGRPLPLGRPAAK